VAPGMWQLADRGYASKHKYFVDGSPVSMDVYDGSGWRTVLVAGLNAGGRGYYAVDITNPTAPKALWEICSDSRLWSISDKNMGYSFGNPVITKLASDGTWVVLVTSGYNNVSPGDGHGYLYVIDVIKGTILQKIDTGVGSGTDPSGLGKITPWIENLLNDNTTAYVYGGGFEGKNWKLHMTHSKGSAP